MGNTAPEIPKVEVETDYGLMTLHLQSRDRATVTGGDWEFDHGRKVSQDPVTINRVDYVARFDLVTESAWLAEDQFRTRVNSSISSGINPAGRTTRLARVSPIWPHWSIDFDSTWHGLKRLDNGEAGSDSARKVLTESILDTLAIRLQGLGTELDNAEILARARFGAMVEDRIGRLQEVINAYLKVREVIETGAPLVAGQELYRELGDNPRPWLIEAMYSALNPELIDTHGLATEVSR